MVSGDLAISKMFLNVVSEVRGCLEADCKKTLYGLTASGFFESGVRGGIFSNFCSIKGNVLCPGVSVFFFTHILFYVKKKT